MPSLLQQLENNEAVLLMYLTDELPADDRAEVEQMLASDANLRAELEAMQAVHATVAAGLRELDRDSAPLVSEFAVVRKMGRVLRQWKLERFSQQNETISRRRFRMPWWAYPGAAAALVVFSVIAWWGLSNDGPPGERRTEMAMEEEDPATRVAVSLLSQEDNGPGMAEAELQASLLANRSDENVQAADRFMIDPAQLN